MQRRDCSACANCDSVHVRMGIDTTQVMRAAAALGVIGGGTQSAHRILSALCDPALGGPEIATILQREPGLAARVLKVANSAFYGRSREVSTAERALMVLGTDAVRGIAAAACLDRSIIRRSGSVAFSPEMLVSHCVASALAAESIARLRHRTIAADAFMAALLHDFGIPVQERLDPDGMNAVIAALRATPEADVTALESTLGMIGHTECAEVIFDAWQLPRAIVVAARHHHDPLAAPGPARELAVIVHLGVQLALDAGFIHPLEPGPLPVPREPLLKLLQIEADSLPPISETLAERVHLLSDAAV
jgi:HD-like signal output (HDOD) protein